MHVCGQSCKFGRRAIHCGWLGYPFCPLLWLGHTADFKHGAVLEGGRVKLATIAVQVPFQGRHLRLLQTRCCPGESKNLPACFVFRVSGRRGRFCVGAKGLMDLCFAVSGAAVAVCLYSVTVTYFATRPPAVAGNYNNSDNNNNNEACIICTNSHLHGTVHGAGVCVCVKMCVCVCLPACERVCL